MPSASNKLEKQASLEVPEPFKQALSVIEKKVRNLEKRKAKLDSFKNQVAELHDQQKEALTRYEEVVNTLEFSRDLVKQLTQSSIEAAKQAKKQAKRDLLEQQARETTKVREVLMINNVLSAMGDDKTREDFLNGTNGAMTLTEETLQQLDNLFKLVTPSRDIEDGSLTYEQQLLIASEHLVAILEGKKKEVLGTTYQGLKELIFGIHDCGYFKREEEKTAPTTVNGETHEEEETPEEQTTTVTTEELQPAEDTMPVEDVVGSSNSSVGEKLESVVEVENAVTECSTFQPADDSVFSTFTHTKPYTEVFTSSQGSFNFLQESQIDPDSPHMDPAVVAAHPMVPPSVSTPSNRLPQQPPYPPQPQPSELLSSQFPNQSVSDSQHLVINSNSTAALTQAQQHQSHYIQPVTAITATHLPDFSQIPTQTYTNQHYVAVPTFAAPIYGQVTSQTVAQNALMQNEEGAWMENKKHFMNVNATAFESMTYKGEEAEATIEDNNLNAEQQNENQKFSNDSQGYQSGNKSNFQSRSGYSNYRGGLGGGRGGSSGRGARGGGGGVSSSYNGGGNGGRGNRQAGGSYGTNSGNGMRGGAGNYQGYNREGYNNYQRENFNGSGGGFNSSGGPRRGINSSPRDRGSRGDSVGRGSSRGGYAKSSVA